MRSYEEDKDQGFRTIFFLILVLLFILVYADSQENHNAKPATTDESIPGIALGYANSLIYTTIRISDLYKYDNRGFHFAGIDLFSIRNKLSCYNHKIAQCFLVINQVKLSKTSFLPFKIYFHHFPIDDDSLPSLS